MTSRTPDLSRVYVSTHGLGSSRRTSFAATSVRADEPGGCGGTRVLVQEDGRGVVFCVPAAVPQRGSRGPHLCKQAVCLASVLLGDGGSQYQPEVCVLALLGPS